MTNQEAVSKILAMKPCGYTKSQASKSFASGYNAALTKVKALLAKSVAVK